MSLVFVKSGEAGSVVPGTVITAQATIVNLLASTPLPAGTAISEKITKFPNMGAGRIRLTLGAGGTTFALKMTASDTFPPWPRSVPDLALAGPGTYTWPPGRSSLAYALRQLTGPMPGGTLAVDLLSYAGKVAADAATGVLGIVQPGPDVLAGALMILVSAGPAFATCSGGWMAGDKLVCAAAGALRKLAPMETGLDQVAVAVADQSDGDTNCRVTVTLQAI